MAKARFILTADGRVIPADTPAILSPEPEPDPTPLPDDEDEITELVTLTDHFLLTAEMVTADAPKSDRFYALRLYGYGFPDDVSAYTEEQITEAWRLHEHVRHLRSTPDAATMEELRQAIGQTVRAVQKIGLS